MTQPLRMTVSQQHQCDTLVRLAFERAQFVADAKAEGDSKRERYHKAAIVELARALENGLTAIRAEQDKFDNRPHPHPEPSTTIKPVHASGILPPVGARRAVFAEVMAKGKAAFPQVTGLTCITTTRAFFQRTGDATPYSVAITLEQAVALGYVIV